MNKGILWFIKKNKLTFIFIAVTLSVLAFCAFCSIRIGIVKNSLPDQNLSQRWSSKEKFGQVSIYFDDTAEITAEYIWEMRESLAVKVDEADYKEVTGRTFLDSYSGVTERTYEGLKTGTFETICTEGDFFEFHPLEMITGSCFAPASYDLIVVDENVAWQLFGSNDIVGMTVYVGEIPFTVSGVCRSYDDDLHVIAGGESPKVYMSLAGASDTGETPKITTYEVLMPNPVKNYAKESVNGANASPEKNSVVVDNTSRFGYTSLYDVYKGRKFRAVRNDTVKLPAWENIARVKEDELAPVAVTQTVLLSLTAAFWIVWIVTFIIRHKPNKQTLELFEDKIREIKGGHTDE